MRALNKIPNACFASVSGDDADTWRPPCAGYLHHGLPIPPLGRNPEVLCEHELWRLRVLGPMDAFDHRDRWHHDHFRAHDRFVVAPTISGGLTTGDAHWTCIQPAEPNRSEGTWARSPPSPPGNTRSSHPRPPSTGPDSTASRSRSR